MSALESFLESLNERRLDVERIDDPAAFYEQNAAHLAAIGADAFGQLIEGFEPQVEERFSKAAFGHALRADGEMVGFGLFDTLRGHHWRLAFN